MPAALFERNHLHTFSVNFPCALPSDTQLIDGHVSAFDADVAKMSPKLVDATIELHRNVMNNFLPSAVKFHYQFNLREMTNMTQGICRMMKEYYREPIKVGVSWRMYCWGWTYC